LTAASAEDLASDLAIATAVIGTIVIGIAMVGYFVGP
jgi:hypothetical protein